MRRRILLGILVVVVTIATVTSALWYSGVFQESDCVKRGGMWVKVRSMCVVDQ